MLAEAILALKDRVQLCSRCFSITEDDPCAICTDERRDTTVLCVVAEAKDVFALERTGAFKGRYHVLGGVISPMDGIGPAQLHVKELVDRVAAEAPDEVLVATNPNAEGEATALYLSRLLVPAGLEVTRLAYGLPIGGDLDYADEVDAGQSPRRPPPHEIGPAAAQGVVCRRPHVPLCSLRSAAPSPAPLQALFRRPLRLGWTHRNRS